MRHTTKQRIQDYLGGKGWVSGTELESLAEDWQTKSSVITRRARELANEGKIERQLSNIKTVQYKLKSTMTPKQANDFLKTLEIEAPAVLSQGSLL